MNRIKYIEREMTDAEFARMNAAFDEHTLEQNVAIQRADRFGFVALDGDTFIGCSSGLAYKNGEVYSGWFYLTDLFVEKAYRCRGIGARLLAALEETVRPQGVDKIWTWTAGYEAPEFYAKQGYAIFAELEDWYSSGDSRVALRKNLMD